ncbi:Predicted signal-transduction protein containing cAMP-binding and CBS domains [Shewanella baltica]|nr:Predicted signal-transduction protein containing cAMP-binding and CBS domains [Shewanella baltica]
MKHKGNALINDIARVYALSAGIKEVNTAKRIRALMDANILNRKDALNLADAHEFIAHMRLSNQGYQHNLGLEVSNICYPRIYLRWFAISYVMPLKWYMRRRRG